ncbi:uncharacterized protein LOC135165727 [Diachasmimorpha longicaudata]|uniref:uncharacterized protein LOC135165727 n=1 Tax=Diachasmimorpha longicaudata TaxID=58733 RepID=UPI0030B8E6E9
MNSFLIIAFVAMASIALSEALDPFAGITRLKNDVKSTSSDIERYGNKISSQTKLKLGNLKINQMQNVNDAVNRALDQIRSDIAAAKKDGKNADQCYEPSRMQLRDASNTVFKQLDKCVNDAVEPLNPVVSNIASHVTRGQLLLSELDGIALSCVSGNALQVQMCVVQKMPAANAAVNSYKSTASQLKNTGDSISNSAPVSATRCFQQPMSDLYSATSTARTSATQCIRNA